MVGGFRGEEKEGKGKMEQYGKTGRRERKKMWDNKRKARLRIRTEKKENEMRWRRRNCIIIAEAGVVRSGGIRGRGSLYLNDVN